MHLFPHWNWKAGQTIDVWAYYNHADEVELFLNGKSLGVKKKTGDDLHVMWRVVYEPGTLKAVSRKDGKVVLTKEVKNSRCPCEDCVECRQEKYSCRWQRPFFVTLTVYDKDGNVVPDAANLIKFSIVGNAFIAATDNGCQTDLTSFQSPERKAFNGLALAVVQSNGKTGTIKLTATSAGLPAASIEINAQ